MNAPAITPESTCPPGLMRIMEDQEIEIKKLKAQNEALLSVRRKVAGKHQRRQVTLKSIKRRALVVIGSLIGLGIGACAALSA